MSCLSFSIRRSALDRGLAALLDTPDERSIHRPRGRVLALRTLISGARWPVVYYRPTDGSQPVDAFIEAFEPKA